MGRMNSNKLYGRYQLWSIRAQEWTQQGWDESEGVGMATRLAAYYRRLWITRTKRWKIGVPV